MNNKIVDRCKEELATEYALSQAVDQECPCCGEGSKWPHYYDSFIAGYDARQSEVYKLRKENEELRMANHILTDYRMRSACIDFYALDDEAKQIVLTTMKYMIKQYAKVGHNE